MNKDTKLDKDVTEDVGFLAAKFEDSFMAETGTFRDQEHFEDLLGKTSSVIRSSPEFRKYEKNQQEGERRKRGNYNTRKYTGRMK